ncbi:HEAT repeat domain-containing protein [Actinoallomurus sp. NBC_01490]|uniref:HEAT repeat domain-containing protein n=1 Tax=Actinoallomurus sp. NBC_01490 TaxID=2903557 RepID=UPI002E2FA9C7|nr:HEAT repeat domain-containing protein [Actinoallomurus sp. NBC_01490]
MATDRTIDNTHRALAARLLGLKLGDRRAVSLLLAMARDEESRPYVRMRAAFGLARLDDDRGVSILMAATRRKTSPEVPLAGYSRLQAARYLARLGDRRALAILGALSRDDTIAPVLRRRAGAARKRAATRNYFDLPVEQRMLDEFTGGRVRRRLMPLLARPAGLFLPVIVRRYGRDIDAMFGDASPADAPEDAGGAADPRSQ